MVEFELHTKRKIKLKEKFTQRTDYSFERFLLVFMYLWLKKDKYDKKNLSQWLEYSPTNTGRIINDLKEHLGNNMITEEFNLPVYLENFINQFIQQFNTNQMKNQWINYSTNYENIKRKRHKLTQFKVNFPNGNTGANVRRILEEKKKDFYKSIIINKELHNLKNYFGKKDKSDIIVNFKKMVNNNFPLILFLPVIMLLNEENEDIYSSFYIYGYYQFELVMNPFLNDKKVIKGLTQDVKKRYKNFNSS